MSRLSKSTIDFSKWGSEHYRDRDVEVIDYLKANLLPEEYKGFLKGNITKYLVRCNSLDPLKKARAEEEAKDAKKALHYAFWLYEATKED